MHDTDHRITRRTFHRSASGALAAGLALPAIVPARARAGMRASERIGVGFIGTGLRARELLSGWLPSDRLRVVAVCDVDATRREHAKGVVDKAYGDGACAAYVDYRELLAREDIDAVAICTPDHWHAVQIVDACAAGKDIYCEKPLTLTLREGRVCIDAVRRAQRVFQTGSQQRTEYDHRFVTACELVRAGRIGRVLSVNVGVGDPARWCDLPGESVEAGLDWDRWLGPAPLRAYHQELSPRGVHGHYPTWRGYREYSGGYFTDMGAHHYDIAQWGLAMDESGPSRVELAHDPRETMRGARLIYGNGVVLTHGGPSGTTFIGTDGMIHVDRGRLIGVPDSIIKEPMPESAPRLPRHTNHLENWLDCIHSRERCICDVEVGARTMACCQLVNLAYWNSRNFAWDPKAWRLLDADASLMDYERRSGYELRA